MTRAERIEGAIRAARAVAASTGARELSARPAMPGDRLARGTWTPEDERRLRERGEIVMPDGRVYRIKGDV